MLVAGEPGNAIVEAVAPLPGEEVVHKPGKGAFWNTDLEARLERLGITHLIVTGVTTEVCVQTTMREANDRGYDCVVVADATESYFPEFKKATLEMIVAQGAIVGWACQSADVVSALKGHSPLPPPSAPRAAAAMKRTLLAVSGTLQCGFELRANLDHPEWTAVLVGSAVVRGVRAHLDIKEPGCREHRASADGHARVNPANVVTGDPTDANLYAVYLCTRRSCSRRSSASRATSPSRLTLSASTSPRRTPARRCAPSSQRPRATSTQTRHRRASAPS